MAKKNKQEQDVDPKVAKREAKAAKKAAKKVEKQEKRRQVKVARLEKKLGALIKAFGKQGYDLSYTQTDRGVDAKKAGKKKAGKKAKAEKSFKKVEDTDKSDE